ncbi:hypothetical protein PENSPDRAFT_755351 [Peniophora sp. CONT]|nr:hypothetical protein PENSPDRAFT_755351 [Peniophora sp. CONT]
MGITASIVAAFTAVTGPIITLFSHFSDCFKMRHESKQKKHETKQKEQETKEKEEKGGSGDAEAQNGGGTGAQPQIVVNVPNAESAPKGAEAGKAALDGTKEEGNKEEGKKEEQSA